MVNDIRWKQRFENFQKALQTLLEIETIQHPNKAEEAGLIQVFEYTFELGWKVLKDLLQEKGFDPKFPRDTIKLAFQTELIQNGHVWLSALNNRNLMAHTYSEENAKKAIQLIKEEYIPMLTDMRAKLTSLTDEV